MALIKSSVAAMAEGLRSQMSPHELKKKRTRCVRLFEATVRAELREHIHGYTGLTGGCGVAANNTYETMKTKGGWWGMGDVLSVRCPQ